MKKFKGFEIHTVEMDTETGKRIVGYWGRKANDHTVTCSAPTIEKLKTGIANYRQAESIFTAIEKVDAVGNKK